MTERQEPQESPTSQEDQENIEEQLPASLATKSALRTGLIARAGQGMAVQIGDSPRRSLRPEGPHIRTYQTPNGLEARVRNAADNDLTLTYRTQSSFVAGATETEVADTPDQRIIAEYRLRGENDDLGLVQTYWPEKTDDDPEQELTEAAAKRLLVDVSEFKNPPFRYKTK